ncbi:MAG: O-succinylhomoserine sulfhydrylase [Saprospiraceae bacterium]|nr:O-succinylhomoserine sulfhydrylase [Saprospiraceae bacterium]
MKFETKAIRLQTDRSQHKEHSTPLFPTSSFVFDDAEDMRAKFDGEVQGNIYSRFTNPSVAELETKMAALEGGEKAIATASGMSAIFTCFASFLSSGDHLIMSRAVFGSTFRVTENYLLKWGITFDFADPGNVNSWTDLIRPETKILYLETPSNPGLEIIDLEEVAKICKQHNILMVVDNCFATPYLQKPLKYGADIVIHSATKYIDGQGRVLGGVIVSTADLIAEMIPFMKNAGPSLSPFNAWILSKSLETLAVRMDRHCSNAHDLALRLEMEDGVKSVRYPFKKDHPGYKIATKQMSGGGGIVAFEVENGLSQGQRFLDAIKMCSLSANLGDTRTIVTHPASTTHSKLTVEQRAAVGITDGLIRVSVGLEHIDDIFNDISQALKASMNQY